MGSSVSYTPRDDGLAQVTAAVIERPMLPASTLAVAAAAVRVGDGPGAASRMRRARPAAASCGRRRGAGGRTGRARSLGLAAPAPFGGVWEMSFVNERETYGVAAEPFQERRRTLSFSFADWMTGTTRWEVMPDARTSGPMVRQPAC